VYTVIIAKNIAQVVDYYTGTESDIRVYIACFLIPLILLSWVPNLKYLAPFSGVANAFMGIGLLITFYYCVMDMPDVLERPLHTSILKLPPFFGIVIFAMEAVSLNFLNFHPLKFFLQKMKNLFLDRCCYAVGKFNENAKTFYRNLWSS
jgi:proton-coupled amino acid transporter